MPIVTRADKVIDGHTFHARIEQAVRAAYIAVWGNGQDHDCVVATGDAHAEMLAAANGISTLPEEQAAVLRMAALVFSIED